MGQTGTISQGTKRYIDHGKKYKFLHYSLALSFTLSPLSCAKHNKQL